MIPIAGVLVVLVLMLVELRVSRRHEIVLRHRGAVAASDPVYSTMRWAYPAVFVVMAVDGWWSGPVAGRQIMLGLAIFGMAKLLKGWAMFSLGERWSYRVLVLPGAPLVESGPYRWIRHPNYVGVVGELVGFALIVGARAAGVAAVVFFGELLRRRVRAEEQALGRYTSHKL
jgi:methyltransferase